jgi:hypothetical protein
LAALPPIIARIPAAESGIGARELLQKIVASGNVSHQGVAESDARFQFPDFRRAQHLIELFGEKTTMRVWRLDERRWRVDELDPIGERGTYSDPSGLWVWNSGRRHGTQIEGHADVRFARSADLVPSELGRRLAAAASPDVTARLPPRRIAGVHAAGLRISPRSPTTTLERIDMWADPRSGLAVARAAATYGSGFDLVAALALRRRFAPFHTEEFERVPEVREVKRSGGTKANTDQPTKREVREIQLS